MVSNISLNQFAPNQPIDGLYVYMANEGQLHNVIISANQTDPLPAGAVVTLDQLSSNTHAPEVEACDPDGDMPFGIISYTPVQAQHVTGQRVGLAREHDVIWKKAEDAIAVGNVLTFTSDYTVKAANPGSGNSASTIGVALTPAAAKGDFVQVELKFGIVTGA